MAHPEECAQSGSERKDGGADMRNPAGEEQGDRGATQIVGLKQHGAGIEKFPSVVECNDGHDEAAEELNLIIIGEASNQIPTDVEEHSPQIPWALIRAMRNRLVNVCRRPN